MREQRARQSIEPFAPTPTISQSRARKEVRTGERGKEGEQQIEDESEGEGRDEGFLGLYFGFARGATFF